MIERPGSGRAHIQTKGNSIHIEIPTKKQWFFIIFSIVWMCGWTVGFVLPSKDSFPAQAVPIAMVGTVFGYVFFIAALSWMFAGRELIYVDNKVIEIGRKIFGLKFSKKYVIKDIKRFTLIQTEPNVLSFGTQRQLFSLEGNLKFDYGFNTIKFCSTDEAESLHILQLFRANANFEESNFDQA